MFRKTLKKQQKLHLLQDMLGNVEGQHCLLMTCGDNNGALNWYFKQGGGEWFWVDCEQDSVEQIGELTGDPVTVMNAEAPSLPYADGYFDNVVTIDVHEHLADPEKVNRELYRIVKPGGRVIVSTPNGDETKMAVRIKHMIGMNPAEYGHVVVGYDIPDLEDQLIQVGLRPYGSGSYSRFFTEMLELLINFAYVKVLSKKSEADVKQGQIAPQNKDQMKSVEKSYKIYSLAYPFFLAISKLDNLIRFSRGYAVVVEARKG
jgi:ubiquinone/menaquinone biosynthesis C-methylase UbiE